MISVLHRIGNAGDTLVSIAIGACLTQSGLIWMAVHGTRASVLSAGLLAVASALGICRFLVPRSTDPNQDEERHHLLVGIAITATAVVVSWLAPSLLTTAAELGARLVGPEWTADWVALLPSAVILTLIVTVLIYWHQLLTAPSGGGPVLRLISFAIGSACMLLHAGFAFPLAATTTSLIVLSAAAWLTRRVSQGRATVEASPPAANSVTNTSPWLPAQSLSAGVLLVAIMETMSRLATGTAVVGIITVSLTLCGLAALRWLTYRRPPSMHVVTIGGLAAVASLPFLFSALIEYHLICNARIESAWLLLICRAFPTAAFCIAAVAPVMSSARLAGLTTLQPAAAIAAGMAIGWAGVHLTASPMQLLVSGLTAASLSWILQNRAAAGSLNSTGRRIAFTTAISAAVVLPLLMAHAGRIDSASAAQLLFSDRAAVAVRMGVERELIPQSESVRLYQQRIASDGELTVWRRSGFEFEFRRNGRLLGRVSSNTELCPQPAEDVMLAVLPLTMHPEPRRILLLGDATGACLRTCSGFPLQTIVAIRPSAESTAVAADVTWQRLQQSPASDERVTLQVGSAPVAIRGAQAHAFDVVISNSGDSATAAGAAEFTEEYYRAAQRQLMPGGVFCQRFRQPDFGPRPLEHVLATLSQTFAHAMAVQTVPGEVVLLGTDDPNGLIDDQLLTRLQRHHVRREIATAGWDWCQVAALPMLDAKDPMGLFADRPLPSLIGARNAWLLMAQAVESARSDNKSAEQLVALAPHQTVIAEHVASADDLKEMNRRLSALAQQTEILCGIPDQPFVYRKSLRMELQQNPRPPVEVIRNGDVARSIHPLDKLRRDYFVALGTAIQQSQQSAARPEEFEQLAEFTSACEPLLSYFAHHELIRLHELSGHPDPATELRHRMHVVYFAQQADASVRPVIAALDQLTDDTSLVRDETERFDQLNAMLQKLIERWEARTAWEPRSALRVQYDVDASIHAVNRALTCMEDLTDTVGVPREDFLRRRRFVHAALVAPLRNYREQVLAHRIKNEESDADSVDDGSDLPLLVPSMLNTN